MAGDKLIQDAQAALKCPNCHLELSWRYRIWRQLESSFPSEFQIREASLALLVVKDLEPLWVQLSLESCDRRVFYEIVELCNGTIKGEIDKGNTLLALNDRMSHGQHIQFKANRWKDFYIVRAAASACMCAIRGEIHPDGEANDAGDEDLDADDFDTHFLASCAFADGPPWEPDSVSDARRSFWRRWLSERVPLVFVDDIEGVSVGGILNLKRN